MTDKETWLAQCYTPFEQECRERFYLAATNFMFSNLCEGLSSGYYFEFGCHKARTMRYAWKHTQHNFAFTYVGFDSFEGLPEIDPVDQMAGWRKGFFAMSEEDFTRTVRNAGMPPDRLVTVKGFYDKTLTPELADRFLPRKASIIYVDCDLYRSTVPVLAFIRPFLQVGTVIAFDDWNCYLANPGRGQRLAWREFLEANPELRFESFYWTHMMASFVFTGYGDMHADEPATPGKRTAARSIGT
jgi:hypothetical protein